MPSFRQYLALVRHLGPDWILFRVGYALRRRSGGLRRATPALTWNDLPMPALALRAITGPPAGRGDASTSEAENILRGQFRLFSHRVVDAGLLPDWHQNQLTGEKAPSDSHWTKPGDFSFGDIKGIWELSRFPWAFALARAYARTGNQRFAERFWQLFQDWLDRNPPNLGPNWMCGQEATFRLMAVTFASEVCGVSQERSTVLSRFVVATGRRIAANLDYALSQKNNHGVSECVGLITCALLIPTHAESTEWLERGLRSLRTQLSELVYEDGGFSQHSLIYHRVLLHDLCWVRSRLATAGQPVPEWLNAAGWRATDFLMALMDPNTGQAALYGSNDGANVLPLAEADFLDMRPTVQLAAALFRRELPLPSGPWDEAVGWIAPQEVSAPRVSWPALPVQWHARAAGCLQLTNGDARLFLRCPERFRHRPAQADMLHVDVWHRGRAVAHDGGSFSYNSNQRFTALKDAAFHNALRVDATEPMQKFGRFLYLPWPKGVVTKKEEGGVQVSHDGYSNLGIRWTREIRPAGAGFRIRDKLENAKGHRLTWHWLLADAPWRFTQTSDAVETLGPGLGYRVSWTGPKKATSRTVRADETSAYGWWSPHYGEVEPAVSLLIETLADGDLELVTEFQPLN